MLIRTRNLKQRNKTRIDEQEKELFFPGALLTPLLKELGHKHNKGTEVQQ